MRLTTGSGACTTCSWWRYAGVGRVAADKHLEIVTIMALILEAAAAAAESCMTFILIYKR